MDVRARVKAQGFVASFFNYLGHLWLSVWYAFLVICVVFVYQHPMPDVAGYFIIFMPAFGIMLVLTFIVILLSHLFG